MKTSTSRREMIRIILCNREVFSHEDLIEALADKGIFVSQSTLSRDLQQMKAIKIPCGKRQRYIIPETPGYQRVISPEIVPDYLKDSGLISATFSANICVLRTRKGYAGGIASDIDEHYLPTVCGTVSGNDTILVVIAEGASRQAFTDDLAKVLPAIKSIFL